VREHLDVTSKILQCPHVASCDKTGCNGGRAFQIRDKTFCSPHCGNTHFGLSDDDEDYWSETEQEDEGTYCETCDWHNGGEYDLHPVRFCDWTCKDCGVITLSEEEENHPDMVGLTYEEKCQKWVEKWISEMKRDF